MAEDNQPPFHGLERGLQPKWNWIFARSILAPEVYDVSTVADLEREVRISWGDFLARDLPAINAVLAAEEWLWKPNGQSDPDLTLQEEPDELGADEGSLSFTP
jgi:hypothetical protein